MPQTGDYSERELQELDYITLQQYRWMSFGEKRYMLRNFNSLAHQFAAERRMPKFIHEVCMQYVKIDDRAPMSRIQGVGALCQLMRQAEASIALNAAQRKPGGYRNYLIRRARICFHLKQFHVALQMAYRNSKKSKPAVAVVVHQENKRSVFDWGL